MAFQILPPARPQQDVDKTEAILKDNGIDLCKPVLLGIRGYYMDTMGEKGKNDRKIYDDAIIICSPTIHVAFNANTDPGAFRKGIANLVPGKWLYKIGIHGLSKPKPKQYLAFVQAAPVTLKRDELAGTFSGFFGLNIHKGSRLSVSSLGCQTIWPGQWDEFFNTTKDQMKQYSVKTIPYLLIEAKS